MSNYANRYERAFAEAKSRGETLFMPYLMAGFPSQAETVGLAKALHDGGGGAIELGMPFSDPLADGPTIQVAVPSDSSPAIRSILGPSAATRMGNADPPGTCTDADTLSVSPENRVRPSCTSSSLVRIAGRPSGVVELALLDPSYSSGDSGNLVQFLPTDPRSSGPHHQ